MVPFQDGQCAITSEMLYFYHDVLLQVRQETPSIFIRNHPTKKEGYGYLVQSRNCRRNRIKEEKKKIYTVPN